MTAEGVDVKRDPIGTLGALATAGKDFDKIQKEIEAMGPTEPAAFAKLIEVLPDVPAGWTSAAPKGSTNSMGDFKMSQASRRYRGSGTQRVNVEIADWAFSRAMYAPFFLQAKFSQESDDGYSKGITIGEDPGREEYKVKRQDGSRQVLFKKRYHLKVEVNNMPKEAIEEWWGKLKTAALP